MPPSAVAYLGPQGSFAHLVSRQRYGSGYELVPCPSIDAVFEFVAADPERRGIVPIENSSGGTIYDTVDLMIAHSPRVTIREELSINVRLALLGHREQPVKVVYSHFVPLHHYRGWLQRNLPGVEQRNVSSTSLAAQHASREPEAAALSTRDAAEIYGLDVLRFPIEENDTNVTHFFNLGQREHPAPESSRTAMAVTLPNRAGSLHSFLGPFADAGVDLKRIVSRPIYGQPETYVFFIELEGTEEQTAVQNALRAAEEVAATLVTLGSYPVVPRYES